MPDNKETYQLLTLQEFNEYINNFKVGRTLLYVQQHHTYSPDYNIFTGNNHLEMQKAMRDYHVNVNGWQCIGQHFTTFPDGTIMTGRNMELSPAGIYGFNSNAICIENVGNFDSGKDVMTSAQSNTIVAMTALMCNKFNIPVNTDRIVYHHWFDMASGVRNNGSGGNKSCPGSAFFGGNRVIDCEENFLPLVRNVMSGIQQPLPAAVKAYRIVNASRLNVRTLPSTGAPLAPDRSPVTFGAVVRIYEETGGWYRIANSAAHWIYGGFTRAVKRAVVNATTLNVRNGAGTQFAVVGKLTKGTEIFITAEKDGWSQVGLESKWVKDDYLTVFEL